MPLLESRRLGWRATTNIALLRSEVLDLSMAARHLCEPQRLEPRFIAASSIGFCAGVGQRCGALEFVPGKSAAFYGALHSSEQHHGKQLAVSEAL